MNLEEAKLILGACRPDGQDDSDPHCAEALQLAQTNPALRDWWLVEAALDAAVARKLREVTTPAGMKASILAGANIQQRSPQKPWIQRMALAASILALLGASLFWATQQRSQTSFASFRRQMVEMLANGSETLDLHTQNLGDIRKHLAVNAGLKDFIVPASLENQPTYGCQKLTWNGRRVAMVCFKQGDTGVVHCFIIDTADLPKPTPGTPTAPDVDQLGRWATATWERNGKTYMLAAEGETGRLRKLL